MKHWQDKFITNQRREPFIISCLREQLSSLYIHLCHYHYATHSHIKVPLDVVVVSTDGDGFLNREEYRVDAVFHQTLRESLKETIQTLITTDNATAVDVEMICYEGNCNVGILLNNHQFSVCMAATAYTLRLAE